MERLSSIIFGTRTTTDWSFGFKSVAFITLNISLSITLHVACVVGRICKPKWMLIPFHRVTSTVSKFSAMSNILLISGMILKFKPKSSFFINSLLVVCVREMGKNPESCMKTLLEQRR